MSFPRCFPRQQAQEPKGRREATRAERHHHQAHTSGTQLSFNQAESKQPNKQQAALDAFLLSARCALRRCPRRRSGHRLFNRLDRPVIVQHTSARSPPLSPAARSLGPGDRRHGRPRAHHGARGGVELHEGPCAQPRCAAAPGGIGLIGTDSPLDSQAGIGKLIRLLEGEPEEQFNAEQYMNLYT